MDMDRMVKAYLRLRDARTELTRKYDEENAILKEKQKKIEAAFLAFLNESKTDSVKTSTAVVYKQEEVTPTCNDWSTFYEWIKTHDAFDALERRVKKTFVTEYMEANKGAIPPGVSVYREYAVRVRRS